MKNKLLIVLFIILFILSACSSKQRDVSANANEEINAASDEESDKETKEIKEEVPKEVDEENSNKKEGLQEDLMDETVEDHPEEKNEEPIQEAVKAEEPSNQSQAVNESDNQKTIEETDITEENTLKVQGLIANELKLTLNDLKKMEDLIFEADFYSLNSFGTTGYTHFKGVNLWSLLEGKASILPEAAKVTFIAQDGYKMEFTIDQVKKQDYIDETNPDAKYPIIIAWEENGEEYDSEEGAPYKLVVGQKEAGDVNKPQWVSNIDRIVVE